MRPSRIRDFKMENIENTYDLRTITPDRLQFLLSTARDELVKYTNCKEEVEWRERRIAEERNKENINDDIFRSNQMAFCICIVFIVGVGLCILGDYGSFWKSTIVLLLVFVSFFYVIISPIFMIIARRRKKAAQNNLKKYEPQLPDIEQAKEKAINDFKALLFVPDKYWDEYALTKMLEYVKDKRASNWERVTDLYEEHLYRFKMEDNARQTLEQSRLQTELTKQTRSRAGWAAAGAWATAAGIWRR